jgi:hypothetical protein
MSPRPKSIQPHVVVDLPPHPPRPASATTQPPAPAQGQTTLATLLEGVMTSVIGAVAQISLGDVADMTRAHADGRCVICKNEPKMNGKIFGENCRARAAKFVEHQGRRVTLGDVVAEALKHKK